MEPPSSSDSVPHSAQMRLTFESDDDNRRLLDEHITWRQEPKVNKLKEEEERLQYQLDAEIFMNERFEQEQQFN